MLECFDLHGRTAILTSGTAYLGSPMSMMGLAEAGGRVLVTSLEERRARRFAADLPGVGHPGLQLDLQDPQQIDGLVQVVEGEMGRVDILANNGYRDPPEGTFSSEAFDSAFQIGVTSYYLPSEKVVRRILRQDRRDSIIKIASIYGAGSDYPRDYKGLPVTSPPNYHASKGDVANLTRYMAVLWARLRIRVNAVNPGCFVDRRTIDQLPECSQRLCQEIPMERLRKPQELKGIVVHLARDSSSYVTGQDFFVWQVYLTDGHIRAEREWNQ